jgi:hypothetical protein
MRATALVLALATLLLAPRAHALPQAFAGTYSIQIWGVGVLNGGNHGTADVNTGTSPPSFVIPPGVFSVRNSEVEILPMGATTLQYLSISDAKNAQGTFDSNVRKMPFSGLLKFKRMTHSFVATAAIQANDIGAPGKATATFDYVEHGVRGTGTSASPYTTIVNSTVMLTGQSFQITKDSRTAAGGGHIQMIAPFVFQTSIATRTGPTFASLSLDFAPEPGRAVGGSTALAVLVATGLVKRRRSVRSEEGRSVPLR